MNHFFQASHNETEIQKVSPQPSWTLKIEMLSRKFQNTILDIFWTSVAVCECYIATTRENHVEEYCSANCF